MAIRLRRPAPVAHQRQRSAEMVLSGRSARFFSSLATFAPRLWRMANNAIRALTAIHNQARLLCSNQPVSSMWTIDSLGRAWAISSTRAASASLVACSRLETLPRAIGTPKASPTSSSIARFDRR